MRLAQYRKGEKPSAALWNSALKGWIPIDEAFGVFPSELWRIAATTGEKRRELERLSTADHGPLRNSTLDLAENPLIPPVDRPSKILCVGLNYADHAKEFGDPIPAEPVFFCKALSTLTGHGAPIFIPKASSKIDYEAELVVVIGKEGRNIPVTQARSFIAGYACGNDVSCRDWQKEKPAGQWFLGKSFDSFAPVGPALVTPDEIPNPNALSIQSRLNGRVMQSSNTSQFIFPVEELIAYVSRVMTLLPGDLIFTGTPGGIGDRRTPPVYLKPGDIIEVEIEKAGILSNPVRKGE